MSIEKVKKFVKKHETEIAFFTGALLACVGWYISDMQISGGNRHYLNTSVSELNKLFSEYGYLGDTVCDAGGRVFDIGKVVLFGNLRK